MNAAVSSLPALRFPGQSRSSSVRHRRSAGAQVDSTWHDLCLCSRYIVRVFSDMLSATAQQTTAWRRPNRESRWLCGQQGLSVHLNPNGCLLSPRCHCAHTLLKHTDLPPATFHMCCSHHSPNIQHSLLCCPHPPLPFQAGEAAPAPHSIA